MTAYGFPLVDAERVVATALEEDLGVGVDVTTTATIPAEQRSVSHVVARAPGVVAGLPVIALVLDAVAARIGEGAVTVELHVSDGDRVVRGDHLATLRGSTRVTLVAERTQARRLLAEAGAQRDCQTFAQGAQRGEELVSDGLRRAEERDC